MVQLLYGLTYRECVFTENKRLLIGSLNISASYKVIRLITFVCAKYRPTVDTKSNIARVYIGYVKDKDKRRSLTIPDPVGCDRTVK